VLNIDLRLLKVDLEVILLFFIIEFIVLIPEYFNKYAVRSSVG